MRYFQCAKCKTLISRNDVDCYITNKTAESKDWNVTEGNLSNEICSCNSYNKHMRELDQKQFDHETIQRAYVESAGPVPSNTQLMQDLGI